MISRFSNWLDSIHPPIWIDFVRIVVGLFIIYKGVIFTNNFDSFSSNVESVGWVFIAGHLIQVILFVHIVGGIILVLGGYTRLMCLLNIPILAGAVVFNIRTLMTADNYMELPMAVVLLLLLIVIFFTGSGKFSLDNRRRSMEGHRATE